MEFYQLLSKYYDDIFPVSDAKLKFFLHLFQQYQVRNILDIACGSGLLARNLAKAGYDVLGIDLDESMIARAKGQMGSEQSRLEFIQRDMRELASLSRKFGGVICVGNSLAHLLKEDEITAVLCQMFQVTRTGGVTIIQIVNFDRILANGPTRLPDIIRKDKGFAFYRKYVPIDANLVKFQSELVLQDGSTSFRNEITLRAIKKQELEKWLVAVGYTNLKFLGGFRDVSYRQDSYATVVIADKS